MSRWLAVVGVAVVATGLRFADLGRWSFSGDELASTREARVLFEGLPADPTSQTARLPRLIPAGYLVQYLGYRTFGTDEWGSRVPAAVTGSILPPLIVWLLWGPLGGPAAAATGLLLALSPEAVFQSQQNRFYMSAGLVAGGCVAGAAVAVRDRHTGEFCAAGAAAAIAPLFHPVLAALAPGLAAATWLGMPAGPDRVRRRFFLVAGAAVAIVVLVVAGYHLPLLRRWNADAGWGYPTELAILAGVKRLGVPTALLAALGAVLMFRADRPAFGFWAVWAGGWAATLVVLPNVLAYQPAYSFPFLLGPIALAGYAVGHIAQALRERSGRVAAVVWVAAACLPDAPALVSHYADGSRYNHRAAAAFVADRRQPGEAVAAVSPGNLAHYRGELADATGLDPAVLARELAAVGRRGRPTWLVLSAGRSGRDAETQAWLNQRCRLETTIRRPRLDYDEYILDVYKFDPPGPD